MNDNSVKKKYQKKIKLLNQLTLSTSYNIQAEQFKWAPVRMSTGINALNNKLSINLGATFDPYALDENNRRINEFNIKEGGGFFRMSSANMNMNYSLSSKMFEKKKKNNTKDK